MALGRPVVLASLPCNTYMAVTFRCLLMGWFLFKGISGVTKCVRGIFGGKEPLNRWNKFNMQWYSCFCSPVLIHGFPLTSCGGCPRDGISTRCPFRGPLLQLPPLHWFPSTPHDVCCWLHLHSGCFVWKKGLWFIMQMVTQFAYFRGRWKGILLLSHLLHLLFRFPEWHPSLECRRSSSSVALSQTGFPPVSEIEMMKHLPEDELDIFFFQNGWLVMFFLGGLEFLMSSLSSSGCCSAACADPHSVTPRQLCPAPPLSLKGCVNLYIANIWVGGVYQGISIHFFFWLWAETERSKRTQSELEEHNLSWKIISFMILFFFFFLHELKENYPWYANRNWTH